MRVYTPEIAWHNRDPVLSVDIQTGPQDSGIYRLASSGADFHIVVWRMECDSERQRIASITPVCELTRHQKAVNVVRFSPCGNFLASGDDDSIIIIWTKRDEVGEEEGEENDHDNDNVAENWEGGGRAENRENWVSLKTLRLHLEDVYDICWSPDSTRILSGSVDNTAILWNIATGKSDGILRGHKGFVQGVTWDPCNKFVATLGSDRTCRVYCVATRNLVAQCSKGAVPTDEKKTSKKKVPLFHDDTLKTYFRRLCFSPDGRLLIAPTGIIETMREDFVDLPPAVASTNATYVFARDAFAEPVMYYPSASEYSVAVRCCPILFKLRNGEEASYSSRQNLFDLEYRIVIAVATKKTILLYDTEHAAPFAYITDIHYTRLTDICWSSNGRILCASSTDGFCTFVLFSEKELGDPINNSNYCIGT